MPAWRARFASTEARALANRIRDYAAGSDDGTLVDGQPDEAKVLAYWSNAILYGMEGDTAVARKAIDMALGYMQSLTASYSADGLAVSRSMNFSIEGAAFVYDWCNALLTDPERALLRQEVLRVAANTEYGWPPRRHEYFLGSHYCEEKHPTMLAWGIAVYDDDPSVFEAMYDDLIDGFAPVRNFHYAGHKHHQGNAYGASRFCAEVLSTLYAEKLDAAPPYDSNQARVPYYDIYTMMPDGYTLPEGDDWLFRFPPQRVGLSIPYLALARIGQDGYLEDFARRHDHGQDFALYRFFNEDPDLEAQSIDDLPLTRYFGSPFGAMVARTGWDLRGGAASAVASARMTIKEYFFGNHDHLDAGHFSLYYKGTLALDSGHYDRYSSPQHLNYNQRTIAHNTILVLDPKEPRLRQYRGGPELARDGGQMWIGGTAGSPNDLQRLLQVGKRATILAHDLGPDETTPHFSYLKGDIGPAYAAPAPYAAKVQRALRSFVFLNLTDADHPAALIVYDVVRSADPAFAKTWLLHTSAEPQVRGNVTTAVRDDGQYNGKLVNHTLLPDSGNFTIAKVGGPGADFWVDGQNYPPEDAVRCRDAGAWRIELSPIARASEDRFLNVLQVADAWRGPEVPGPEPLEVRRVDAALMVGVAIANSVVLFSRSGDPIDQPISFDAPAGVGPTLDILITDLAAGTWQISYPGGTSSCNVLKDEGTCTVSGPPGTYRLTR